MSGHSKWSKVKHQKATTDVVKAAAFTRASRGIMIAVKEGGSVNPEHNFKLRLAIEKARAVNMPKDNIERVIAKAAGEGIGSLEFVRYEGYGPGGIAFLVEAVTDNRNRTVAQVKNLFDRHGGALVSPGAAMYVFAHEVYPITAKKEYLISLDSDQAGRVRTLIEELEALDDVQTVYTNVA